MKRLLIFFVVLMLAANNQGIIAQQLKTVGLPAIHNFMPKEYGASDQNWAIVQDKRGIIYVANNAGLLQYDGTVWTLIEMPNKSCVRSLCMDGAGKIFVGAVNEFGYLSTNSVGNIKFNSLMHLIPENERNINDVWDIHSIAKKIIFRTTAKLIILENGRIKIIKPYESFHKSFKIGDKIYLRDVGKGIAVFDGNLYKLIKGSEIFANEKIYAMWAYDSNKLLIRVHNQNFFLYDGSSFTKFKMSSDDILNSAFVYCSLKINDNILAIGSILGGLYFIDKSGNLVLKIDKSSGLTSNQIHAVFLDNSHNLWLANDHGISQIEINSPLSYFDERSKLDARSVSIYYSNNKLLVGGFPFLYSNSQFKNLKSEFVKVEKSFQVMEIFPFDNKLFFAQSIDQGFLDEHNKYNSISKIKQAWNFASISHRPNYLIMGAVDGLYYFFKKSNKWIFQGRIKGFDLACNYVKTDSLSNIWIEVLNKGIFRLQLNENGDSITEKKLLLEYAFTFQGLYNLDNQIIATANDKFWKYNYKTKIFEDYLAFNKLFPNTKNIFILGKNKTGDIYFRDKISIGKLIKKKNNQGYFVYRSPFLILEKLSDDYPVIELDESNVFIGRDKGFVHYQPNYKKDYSLPFNILIRKVQVLPSDSVIFGGNFPFSNDTISTAQPKNRISSLSYSNNSFRFLYSATFYESPEKTEYQYQLVGYDNNWSVWTKEHKKEYTNLNEGKYAFKVKAKNVYGTESQIASYDFVIRPPFYRTRLAYLLYFIIIVLFLYAIIKLNSCRLQKEKDQLEGIVKERTSDVLERNTEILKQKDEILLQNNKLREMDEFKQGLTSMIVHDLKNPLNLILNIPTSFKPEKQIETVKHSAKQMLNMVLNILDINKYEDSKFELELASKQFFIIVVKAISQVKFLLDQKNISLKNLIDENLVVRVDEEITERILVNLLTNAIKYSPTGGTITLNTNQLSEDRVNIQVTDTGEGIAADKLHLVFQKFGQVVPKKSGSVQSSGLGLTFCKMAVEAQGGEIGLASEVEKGTTFWFSLQIAEWTATLQSIEIENTNVSPEIAFTKEEKDILLPIIEKLKRFSVYETDDIEEVISSLKQNQSVNIQLWLMEIEKSVRSLNQIKYSNLLNMD